MAKLRTILVHIFAWAGYLLTVILSNRELDENFWISLVCTNVPLIVLFYANSEILFPKLLEKKKYLSFALSFVLFFLFTIALRFILAMIILNATLQDLMDAEQQTKIWSQVRFSLLFTGISFAVWYAKRNLEMTRNQQLLEKEIADARLLSLKNQINPHFLYNTLSFLYTKSLPLSNELSSAIAKLSEMMRYSLGEADMNGKVPLQHEINHLKNFIDIHQMRYGHSLSINFRQEGDVQRHKIVPLLLITFVENAFKHGKVSDKENPLAISLIANHHSVIFSISNKKSNGTKEKSSGIGLQNIRNRLELAYPEKHNLEIKDTNDTYTVTLKIDD